ncbi:MAG: hypothetical protein V3U49_02475 [Nitrososphaerales archaeon]
MGVTERQKRILGIIEQNPSGVGFNELTRYTISFASRPTVRKDLDALLRVGEIVRIGGQRRGTRVEYVHKSMVEAVQEMIKEIEKNIPAILKRLDAWKEKPTIETMDEIAPGFLDKIFYYMAVKDNRELRNDFILQFGPKVWKMYREAGEYILRAINGVPTMRRDLQRRRARFLKELVAPLLVTTRQKNKKS